MARTDIEARIRANSAQFHASMGRIRKDAKVTANSSGSAFEAMSARLRGGLGAAFAGASIAAGFRVFVNRAREAVREVQAIESEAKTAGVSFEDFQELSFSARKNLVSVEALTDGLKEMQLRVDEVVKTGKGSAAESLGRLGYSARELAAALKQPDQLFEDIITRMKDLDRAAQIRVADEIFGGTAGEQFVRMLDEAQGSIAENRREARELGVVIEQDLLDRVKDIDQAWKDVSTTISTRVEKFLLKVVAVAGEALDRLRDINNQVAGTLEVGQVEIDRERLEIENEILRLRQQQRENTSVIAAAENRQIEGQIAALEERLKVLTGKSGQIAKRIGTLSRAQDPTPGGGGLPPGTDLGGGGSRESDADRQRKKILQLIDALEHESRTLKMNQVEQRVANELRKAGALVTPEQTARITELVRANEAEKRSRELANEEIRRQQQIYDRFGGTVENVLDGLITKSMTLEQALVKVGFEAVKAMLQLNKIGGGGGGLGSLFGAALGGLFGGARIAPAATSLQVSGVGLFAKGGISDKPAIFGEGPMVEAAVPLPDGRRIPVDLKNGGGGGDTITAPVYISIDATGADAAELARVNEKLARLEAELPGRIVTTVKDARTRRVLR